MPDYRMGQTNLIGYDDPSYARAGKLLELLGNRVLIKDGKDLYRDEDAADVALGVTDYKLSDTARFLDMWDKLSKNIAAKPLEYIIRNRIKDGIKKGLSLEDLSKYDAESARTEKQLLKDPGGPESFPNPEVLYMRNRIRDRATNPETPYLLEQLLNRISKPSDLDKEESLINYLKPKSKTLQSR